MIDEPFRHTASCTHSYTWTCSHKHTQTRRDSKEREYPVGSLVSVLCGNSVGQVMEQGVMMHQQHQPWVAPPAEVADGTHDWRGAIHSHKHTLTHTFKHTKMHELHPLKLYL